jgi:L-lactate dehydrogenase
VGGLVLIDANRKSVEGEAMDLNPPCPVENVHPHVIDEHGHSEVPVWSMANVTGIGLETHGQRHACAS